MDKKNTSPTEIPNLSWTYQGQYWVQVMASPDRFEAVYSDPPDDPKVLINHLLKACYMFSKEVAAQYPNHIHEIHHISAQPGCITCSVFIDSVEYVCIFTILPSQDLTNLRVEASVINGQPNSQSEMIRLHASIAYKFAALLKEMMDTTYPEDRPIEF